MKCITIRLYFIQLSDVERWINAFCSRFTESGVLWDRCVENGALQTCGTGT